MPGALYRLYSGVYWIITCPLPCPTMLYRDSWRGEGRLEYTDIIRKWVGVKSHKLAMRLREVRVTPCSAVLCCLSCFPFPTATLEQPYHHNTGHWGATCLQISDYMPPSLTLIVIYLRSGVEAGGFQLVDFIVHIIHCGDPSDRGTLCPWPHAPDYINISTSKTLTSSLQTFLTQH